MSLDWGNEESVVLARDNGESSAMRLTKREVLAALAAAQLTNGRTNEAAARFAVETADAVLLALEQIEFGVQP